MSESGFPMKLQKFYMGEAFDAYEYFGAHPDGGGVVFRTYAPNAQRISIVGAFNGWQEQPMEQLHRSGVCDPLFSCYESRWMVRSISNS